MPTYNEPKQPTLKAEYFPLFLPKHDDAKRKGNILAVYVCPTIASSRLNRFK